MALTLHDRELMRQLQLSTEDLRFADSICRRVDETVAEGQFLENTGVLISVVVIILGVYEAGCEEGVGTAFSFCCA